MIRTKTLSLLMALFVGSAFAAESPVLSRTVSSIKSSPNPEVSSKTTARVKSVNTPASRSASRVAAASSAPSQNVASRGTSSATRGATEVPARKTTESGVGSKRAGVTSRPGMSGYENRVVNAENRRVSNRAASNTVTKESIAEAKDILEQTAELNKSCQEQYNECMDQFCSVIDANQKRCSCSANLSKYSKVEDAVNDANTKLNEVAQNIRYIGLSADEIRAIMTATEAEEALSGTRDNTENRSLLERIEDMIKDPTSLTSSYASTDYGLDMDIDFSTEADMFSLDFLNTSTSSFSNLRGTELYNAAKNRCKTVLNQCKKAGSTIQQVTGNYDLAIDKDCIAYENGLKKMNETLVSNVRSAERMLQKARLAVLQNKNQYDAKGCVGALEACMTDDMVCGDDYAKCVDPTKVYIDENGNVVLGKDISKIIKFMKNYSTTKIDSDFLKTAYGMKISDTECAGTSEDGGDGSCVVKYLLQKIGTKQKVTDEGLCRAVLDKCQAYTYADDVYQSYNDIVVNYVQRAMVNIKAAQYKIISDYASSCMVDVANCYNQQVTQVNAWSSAASTTSVMNVMNGACHNVALTCAYAIFANSDENMDDSELIAAISEMFYQSLVCPDNSTYKGGPNVDENNELLEGFVNSACKCNDGYEPWGGYCVVKCNADQDQERNMTTGSCVCKDSVYSVFKNGFCYDKEGNMYGSADTEDTEDSGD